ncbi:MAG: TetR family transcriptional regulator [Chloroflexi bacterium]|nr:TetR family transcriptional regulator [Chloroflexota bacterium]
MSKQETKQETKQALLETGIKLIFKQGYNHTGLNEILEAANIPKGSFYYYFSSKEDFGLQALDAFIERNRARTIASLKDESLDPLARIHGYFDSYASYLQAVECSQGCLLGNLGQELADQNEAFRLKVEEGMDTLAGELATCLRAAQEAGQINPALNADDLAAFIYNSWQGTMLRMKVSKSMEPVWTFERMLFDVLLKP